MRDYWAETRAAPFRDYPPAARTWPCGIERHPLTVSVKTGAAYRRHAGRRCAPARALAGPALLSPYPLESAVRYPFACRTQSGHNASDSAALAGFLEFLLRKQFSPYSSSVRANKAQLLFLTVSPAGRSLKKNKECRTTDPRLEHTNQDTAEWCFIGQY